MPLTRLSSEYGDVHVNLDKLTVIGPPVQKGAHPTCWVLNFEGNGRAFVTANAENLAKLKPAAPDLLDAPERAEAPANRGIAPAAPKKRGRPRKEIPFRT